MRPDDLPPARETGRLEQVRTIALLEPRRSQLRNDQVALIIEYKSAVFMLDEEGTRVVGTPPARRRRKRLPDQLTRIGLYATQIPRAADAVDVAITDNRR